MERNWSTQQVDIFNWFANSSVRVNSPNVLSMATSQAKNLVVRARAGTGKTTTIIEGVNRAPEKSILLAAFNKSIATELQNRVKNTRVEAKTLHGLGYKFIARYAGWGRVEVDDNRSRDLTKATGADVPDALMRIVT